MPRCLRSAPIEPTSQILGEALDQADFGIVLLDRDLRALFINHRFWEIWSIDPEVLPTGPTFRELLDYAVTGNRYGWTGNTLSAYAEEHEAEVRAGSVAPMKINLADERYVLFRCIACRDDRRLLTYFDISNEVRHATSEALERLSAELRFNSETMEGQAAYLATLAESSEENAQKADAARVLLEREIAERHLLEIELRRMATTDGLTGALNRAAFLASGQREITSGRKLVVLMIDVDHFKAINDTYGHAGGDCALQQLVVLLRAASREVDLLGRLGGEEFAIVLSDTSVEVADRVAERLRARVAGTAVIFGGTAISMTVSVGLATQVEADTSIEQIIARADDALYHAKGTGRNRVAVYKHPAVA